MLIAPVVSEMVNPPVVGPVMVRAVEPAKVRLPPKVVRPVPVVIGALLTVFKLRAVGESTTILPVDAEPIAKVCALVVPSTPAPVRNVALFAVPAEIEAVGV